MNQIRSLKTKYSKHSKVLTFVIEMEQDTFLVNVQLMKISTLRYKSIKTIGLSTAMRGVDGSTSRKRSPTLEAAQARFDTKIRIIEQKAIDQIDKMKKSGVLPR